MDGVVLIGYAAGATVFFAMPLCVYGVRSVGRPYNGLVLFSWVFAVSYFVVPILAVRQGEFWHQTAYEPQTMLSALAWFVLFGVMVVAGYVACTRMAVQRDAEQTFDYAKWSMLPNAAVVAGSLVCGALIAAGIAWYFQLVLAHGLGTFLRNRIVLLSGLGYLSAVMLWPVAVLTVLLAHGHARAQRSGGRRGFVLVVLFASAAIVAGLVTGSRTTSLMPLLVSALVGMLLSSGGRLGGLGLLRLGGLVALLLLAAVTMGQARERLFARDTPLRFEHATITPAGALVGAYGEYENLWWLVENPAGHDLLGGRTFLAAAVGMVPRRIWPNKPLGGGPYLTNMVHPGGYDLAGGSNLSSFTTGLVAESYMNFGGPGLAVVGFLFGILLSLLDRFRRRVHSPLMFAVWIVLLVRAAFALKAEVFGNVATTFSSLIPIGVFWAAARVGWRRRLWSGAGRPSPDHV